MGSVFGWSVALFAVLWIGLAVLGLFQQYRRGESLNWLVWLGGFLVLLGALGFFGSALLSLGVVSLPSSFEWPSGYVQGIVTSSDGLNIVPLEPSGRVQIYNPQWRFMRGWQVNAEGGPFRVVVYQPGTIGVYTRRGKHHFTYSATGELLASTTYTEPFDSMTNEGHSMVVPTFAILWPFSSPFLSVGLVVIGSLALRLSTKLRRSP